MATRGKAALPSPEELPSLDDQAPEEKPDKKPTRVSKPRTSKIEVGLTDMYTSAGAMVYMFDQTCGMAVINSAGQCAAALDALAKENPAVKRALEGMLTASAWSMVISAHAPIAMTIAAHHSPAVAAALGNTPSREGEEAA